MADEQTPSAADVEGGEDQSQAEAKQRLSLTVKIDAVGACQRHITVTISREDIDRYLDKAFEELVPTAMVPGFRQGHAPRKLVEGRYRNEVRDQVRASLLLDAVTQLSEDHKLAAISEPDLDPMAIELPNDGPMTFEFNIEVRPEFDLPEWKGMVIERPTREITDEDVEQRLTDMLYEHGELKPSDNPARLGDSLAVDIEFRIDDRVLGRLEEEVVRVLPVLSFHDARIENFDQLMQGVRPGDSRTTKVLLAADASNEELRGKEITAEFKVLEVQTFAMPARSADLFRELGVRDEAELRRRIRDQLELQLSYAQHRRVRQQITAALTKAADWELPPELLARQADRELQRAVLELMRSGFTAEEIRAHGNELRQNSRREVARALKEHFILEKLAEQEQITDTPNDYDAEVSLIALQSGESPRRVRARLEKSGQMDALRNQIIERKAIELILQHAQIREVPYTPPRKQAFGVDYAIGGARPAEIPEAKHAVPAASLPGGAARPGAAS